MNIRHVCRDILQKTICLYGDIEDIEGFLEEYGDEVSVQCVLSDYKEEVIKQPYSQWNLSTIMLDGEKLADDALVIVCSKNRFGALVKRLKYLKKKEYVDYISCELVGTLLYGKRLMICMGTQLMEQVSLILRNSKQVCGQYDVVYYSEDHLMEPYMNRLQEHMHVSRYCDVYIRSACEKEKFLLKVIDKEISNHECTVLTVADFGFGGYYPQTLNDRDHISDYLLRGYERLPVSYETLMMSRCDKEIERLCQQTFSDEDILKQLVSADYFEEGYVKQYFDDEISRFRRLEEKSDIQLGDYIATHSKERLCRNLNEWNEPVISYVIKKIGEKLSISADDVDKNRRIELLETASGSEMMIYPSVEKALELQDEKHTYKTVTYSRSQYMTREEYILFMAEYMKKAQELLEYTRMDCMIDKTK